MNESENLDRIHSLPCWSGPVDIEPLPGGITNRNYLVKDPRGKFVVRLGADIPVHGIMRFNELAASRAAYAARISPEVIHAEAGALVMRFIDGLVLTPEHVRDVERLPRIAELIKRCHTEIARHLTGPSLVFWVFQVVRGYAVELRQQCSAHAPLLPGLLAHADYLERAVGPVDIVFSHNDLLAANFIDDGERLWLIDWDYAGFNSPLFDLGGVASNNGLDETQTQFLLESYFGHIDRDLMRRFSAMLCASLLRETMWSMVSEIHSRIAFDYPAYTAENLRRFQRAYQTHVEEFG